MAVVTSNSSRYCIDGLDQSTLLALHVLELDACGQRQRVAVACCCVLNAAGATVIATMSPVIRPSTSVASGFDRPLAAADQLAAHALGHATIDIGIDVRLMNCGTPIVLM